MAARKQTLPTVNYGSAAAFASVAVAARSILLKN